ncbi:MAG: energy coupling factor transporter S component ThiW [Hungatella sp.]|jgi:energy coupling factor transporter S component ThiW|nr:energy coupling factor transporter S component ThiW [Hungatella sp.]
MNDRISPTICSDSSAASRVRIKKLVVSGMLTALTVALSGFSIPVGASKCFPIQHLANVLAGVFLGPVYGVSMAFSASLIRNLMGTGSLLAFPGSMAGAFLGACLFQKTRKLLPAYLGEVIGTGLIGGLLCYPVAALLMGKEVAVFFFVVPFFMSTLSGTVLAAVLLAMLRRLGLFSYFERLINE